jgi:hypothetical protein
MSRAGCRIAQWNRNDAKVAKASHAKTITPSSWCLELQRVPTDVKMRSFLESARNEAWVLSMSPTESSPHHDSWTHLMHRNSQSNLRCFAHLCELSVFAVSLCAQAHQLTVKTDAAIEI